MNIIQSPVQTLFREKGSKFLGFLFPCSTPEEFESQLQQLKTTYYDATHHCFAYRINPIQLTEFSSDDGEPSGTAGLPILNQLKSAEAVNTGAVIVRYFGGTKLGKTGLIEAYKTTTSLLTNQADFRPVVQVQLYQISYPYSEELLFTKLKNDFGLIEQQASYTDSITKQIACPIKLSEGFENYHKRVKHVGIELTKLEKTILAE